MKLHHEKMHIAQQDRARFTGANEYGDNLKWYATLGNRWKACRQGETGKRGGAPGFMTAFNCKGLAQQGKPDQSLVTDRRSF